MYVVQELGGLVLDVFSTLLERVFNSTGIPVLMDYYFS